MKLVFVFPVMARMSPALPARALVGEREPDTRAGDERFAEGVEMVNCNEFDVPAELETETFAVILEAVSIGRIAAVRWVESLTVVVRADPFQFTTESLVNVVPAAAVTVSVKPLRLPQNGAEEGDTEAITCGVPGVEPMVK